MWRTWTQVRRELEYPSSVSPDLSAHRPLASACQGAFFQLSAHPDPPVFTSVTMMFLHFQTEPAPADGHILSAQSPVNPALSAWGHSVSLTWFCLFWFTMCVLLFQLSEDRAIFFPPHYFSVASVPVPLATDIPVVAFLGCFWISSLICHLSFSG